ncbi:MULTISPECIES: extracellular solute-binding protein [unclassified Deinococcus]|jgi:iron(III) transport system substrate-binding protein|uniref:extracellular solute-binding protein n=1 Tax=unclassified Deinococcus TaxID=2623546 RepID=UPI000C17410A|nr:MULTISPECIES: extracellular solute-binding protein [unclassified Deinococcus]MCD0170384.1 extracellular solute-binding protein [Deinococcus sp. 23YEL01]PIG99270.1 iron ABC transporter substrate-binding protein [Deinococcus sp. UR1]
MKRTLLAVTALLLAGTSLAQTKTLTVYSGRAKTFVDPVVQQFERQTGIKVNVRYGTDAQLVAAIREEGSKSPADVFWGNSMGALGELAEEGRFTKLGTALTRNVSTDYLPENRSWLPTTVRFRTLAYNTSKIKPESLPDSILDLPKMTSLKGRIGWTVSYPSFQDFLGAMISKYGEATTRQWLEGMKALQPKDYKTSNVGMLEAMRAGEIDVALTNHYYIQRVNRLSYPIDTYFFKNGDIGNLGNATGAAILKTTKNSASAARFLSALVAKDAQTFFLSVNFEYPVIGNILQPTTMLPYSDVVKRSPRIDPTVLPKNIDKAQKLLRDAGLL